MTGERLLNIALVDRAQVDAAFRRWLLQRAAIGDVLSPPVLARGDNPWHRSRVDGKDSETDILLVFERSSGRRTALHIENKQPRDRLRPGQAALYHRRAVEWLGVAKWADYSDYRTMLIAPAAYHSGAEAECAIFDAFASYEEVAAFVPEYRLA